MAHIIPCTLLNIIIVTLLKSKGIIVITHRFRLSGLAQVDASTSSLPFSHIIACRLRNISTRTHLEHIIINSSSSNADFFASSLSQTHNIAAIHSLIVQNFLLFFTREPAIKCIILIAPMSKNAILEFLYQRIALHHPLFTQLRRSSRRLTIKGEDGKGQGEGVVRTMVGKGKCGWGRDRKR